MMFWAEVYAVGFFICWILFSMEEDAIVGFFIALIWPIGLGCIFLGICNLVFSRKS